MAILGRWWTIETIPKTVRTCIQALFQARYISKSFFLLELALYRVVRIERWQKGSNVYSSILTRLNKDQIISKEEKESNT
jgi:hypothetical protein